MRLFSGLSELNTAPELADPLARPTGVKLDKGHVLAPDELAIIFDRGGLFPFDHISGKQCGAGANEAANKPTQKVGQRLTGYDLAGVGDRAYVTLPEPIEHTTSQPWSITWYGATEGTDGDNRGVWTGVHGTGSNYIWMKYNGDLSVNVSGQDVINPLVNIDWHRPAWNTIVFNAPGYDFYRDGVFIDSHVDCPSNLRMEHLGSGYSTDGFNFRGWLGAVYIHSKALQVPQIAELHNNPYQIFEPANDSFAVAAPAAGTTVAITGVAGTSAAGSVAASIAIALTGVLGTSAVGTVSPGVAPVEVAISGVASTSAAGNVSTGIAIPLTGTESTSAVGSVTQGQSIPISGVASTSAVGTVTAGISVALTGNQATGAVGTVSVDGAAAEALTGVENTSAVGSVGLSKSISLSGVAGTSAAGTVGPSLSVSITGDAVTTSVGSVGLSISGTAALTGIEATTGVGSVIATGGDATFNITKKYTIIMGQRDRNIVIDPKDKTIIMGQRDRNIVI